jgi:hypothetical protein
MVIRLTPVVYLFLILIAFIYFIIIILINTHFRCLENFAKTNVPLALERALREEVPKIIWTYWDSPDIPEIVKICLTSWKNHAQNYKINIINKNTAEQYVNMPESWKELPAYRQSDIIRLLLLEKYGGIWIDASTILLKNPYSFVKQDGLTLFITPRTTLQNPVFENWFISAPPQNNIIKLWVSETLYAIKNQERYVSSSSNDNKSLIGIYNYLLCHLVLKNIYERQKELFHDVKIYDSKETAFYYHEKYQWNNLNKNLLKDEYDPEKLLIKLRGGDRTGMNSDQLLKRINHQKNIEEIK